MGLACSQIRLLTLTARKADCEQGLSISSMHKMSLTREMSSLSQEYYTKLQSKQVSYYANGGYNKMSYGYLMGYGNNYAAIFNGDKYGLKSDNSMILTDFKGQVVLSDTYASAITSVLGSSVLDANGRGGTFSKDSIPAILAKLCPGFDEKTFKSIIDNNYNANSSYSATNQNTLTGQSTGDKVQVDNSSTVEEKMQAIVDFYLPIFTAAASNGWTTEYNKQMGENENYISDALLSGTLQLENADNQGNYEPGTSLTYFVTSGAINARTDAQSREEITAWYNAEKERISEKESYIDMQMSDWSTELEAINTEIQSIQSFIDDAISSVFDWGSS